MDTIYRQRLWLSESGHLVCEHEDCAGIELLSNIAKARNLQNQQRAADGELYNVMNAADLAEFGTLLKSQGKELTCDGGHVVYDVPSKQLRLVVNS